MADLDEIKCVLRSLLIISQRPLAADELAREFKSSEGYDCPYSILGYRNWTSFLQSIPDTVSLRGIWCHPVVTKETEHLKHLVSVAKKPKQKRRITSFRRYPTQNRPQHAYSANIEEHFRKVRQVKEQNRWQDANRQFSSYPSSSQRQDYSHSRSSYAAGPASPKPSHSRQEVNSISTTHIDSATFQPHTSKWGDLSASGSSSVAATSQSHQADSSSSRKVVFLPERLSSDESDDSFYERFQEPEDNFKANGAILSRASDSERFEESPDLINATVRRNLSELLKSNPNGIYACLLPEAYQEKFGLSLNWSELGYDSVVQMASDLPEIFSRIRVKSGDWKLFDANSPLPEEYTVQSDPTVSASVKEKIHNVAKQHPTGIRAVQFPQLYQEYYNEDLFSQTPGFKDVESLFKAIEDSVVHTRVIRRELYVYPAQKPVEPSSEPSSKENSEGTLENQRLFPKEVLGPGESYPPPELPKNLEVLQYLELRVAEVYNPRRFYIMLRDKYIALENLMDDLQDFYREHADKYVMPNSTVVSGQCCAAIFEGEWHRAVIKSVGEKVEVFYADYGTVDKVDINSLRFIHRDFNSLPSQAIRSSLCNIKPPNGNKNFTKEAARAFLELVVDRQLVGLVQMIDPHEPFLELFLIDTNGDTDVHIVDVLVNKNHASYAVDDSSEPVLKEEKCNPDLKETHEVHPALPSIPCSSVPNNLSGIGSIVPPNPQPQVSAMPPPGFLPTTGFQANSPLAGVGALGSFASTSTAGGLNPMLNPALAALYSSYLPQVNLNAALILQQQQQQQAYLLAYYQNLYQQSAAAASLISAQQKAALGSGGRGLNVGPEMQNDKLKLSSLQNSKAPVPSVSSQDSVCPTSIESVTKNPQANASVDKMQGRKVPKIEAGRKTAQKLLTSEEDTCSSDTSDHDDVRRKKLSKKKKKMKERKSSLSQTVSKVQLVHSESDDPVTNSCHSSSKKLTDKSRTCVIDQGSGSKLMGGSPNESTKIKRILQSDHDSSDGVVDIVVDNLDELMYSSDGSLSPSHCNVTPDLVQSVANLSMSKVVPVVTTFWKAIKVSKHLMHLFNVDQKPYFCTGEITHKFTKFSTCDTLVRILKSMNVEVPFKKLERRQNLSLFSALDGCSDDMLKSFDIPRNKNGNVMRIHLTPLDSVPLILRSFNVDSDILRNFQEVENTFSPNDNHWSQ